LCAYTTTHTGSGGTAEAGKTRVETTSEGPRTGLGAVVVTGTVKLLESTCVNTPLLTTTCTTPVDHPVAVRGRNVRVDTP